MKTKQLLRRAVFVAGVAFATSWGVAHAQEVPMVTGEHWTTSTEAAKKAYLVGIANLVQVETAFYAANPPSDSQNFVPRLARGLKGHTLDSVRQGLDRWYAANPGKLERPVLETIWFEMAVPGLKK
jgi:hypothetical protein